MSIELLKKIAAGEEFDLVEGVREIARVLTTGSKEEPKLEPLASSPQVGKGTGSGTSGGAPSSVPKATNGAGRPPRGLR